VNSTGLPPAARTDHVRIVTAADETTMRVEFYTLGSIIRGVRRARRASRWSPFGDRTLPPSSSTPGRR